MNDKRDNCISFIKLLAAIQVFYGHAIIHLQVDPPRQISLVLSIMSGVPVFFVLSGYLIWNSINRSSSFGFFLKKRILRIFPELWMCVLIEIISIIIFYKGWNFRDLSLFAFTQGTIFQFWTPNSLRGYGCGTPNGTLWTMCVTIQFYVVAWLINKLLKNKKLLVWTVVIISSVLVSITGNNIVESFSDLWSKLFRQTILRYGWLFLFGCFLSEFKQQILPQFKRIWYVFLMISLLLLFLNIDVDAGYLVIQNFCLLCGLLGFAYRFPNLQLKIDLSYGIFLYHMIIINIFITFELTHKVIYMIFAFILSAILAYTSIFFTNYILKSNRR